MEYFACNPGSHTHEESQDVHLQGKFEKIPAQDVDSSLGVNRKFREIVLAHICRDINIPQLLKEIEQNGATRRAASITAPHRVLIHAKNLNIPDFASLRLFITDGMVFAPMKEELTLNTNPLQSDIKSLRAKLDLLRRKASVTEEKSSVRLADAISFPLAIFSQERLIHL